MSNLPCVTAISSVGERVISGDGIGATDSSVVNESFGGAADVSIWFVVVVAVISINITAT